MSVMNVVGEWVSRPVPGRSIPRGASEPPSMKTPLSAAFISVVRLREQLHVRRRGNVLALRAELGQPVAVQIWLVADDVLANARKTAHEVGGEKRANCVRAVAVSGVVRLPAGMIVATIRMFRKSPAAAIDVSASSSIRRARRSAREPRVR